MGNRIDFVYTWNVLLIQFLYYIGIILLMVIYGMLSGSMLQVRPRTTGDIVLESLFALMFILAPIAFNIYKYYAFKKQGNTTKGKSHLMVQGLYIIGMVVLCVLTWCKLI